MSELLGKPGVEKTQGERLSYLEINALDTAIDSIVDVVNKELKTTSNVNIEFGDNPDMLKKYTLEEAIDLIPANRRSLGFIIKFFSGEKGWSEYQFIGQSIEVQHWKEVKNRKEVINIIDGGTF